MNVKYLLNILFLLLFVFGCTSQNSIVAPLNIPRNSHKASSLCNGFVLISGGSNKRLGGTLLSAEFYDTQTGTWNVTENLIYARFLHTQTLLNNCLILVAGGNDGVPLFTCELFDFTTQTWTETGRLNTARFGHTASLLNDGNVLVAGGSTTVPQGSYPTAVCELYNSSKGTWELVGNLITAREYHTATLLQNNWVFVTGGSTKFVPDNKSRRESKLKLDCISDGASATSELYDPVSMAWIPAKKCIQARFGHAATLFDGVVFISGGIAYRGGVLSSTEFYNISTGLWVNGKTLNIPRQAHDAILLTNGNVVLLGGDDGARALLEVEQFNLLENVSQLAGNLQIGRIYQTSTRINDSLILVAGGEDINELNDIPSSEIYDAYNFASDQKLSPKVIAGIVIGAVAFIIGAVFTIRCLLKPKPKIEDDEKTPLNKHNLRTKLVKELGQRHLHGTEFIQRNDLQLDNVLGEGNYGVVYKAWFRNAAAAAKKAKTEEYKLELIKEAATMSRLRNHLNVLQYYGVCLDDLSVDDPEVFLVNELCDFSLLAYLRDPKMVPLQKCSIASQIAAGMAHLEKEGILHRDLAARNVLLVDRGAKGFVAKVADFGLSRELRPGTLYYRHTNKEREFALHWLPPEYCGVHHKFYLGQSDVWSFGVLLWEIWTNGQTPHAGLAIQAVLAIILDPKQVYLPQPDGCPNDVYHTMRSCWKHNYLERPKFEKLTTDLLKLNIPPQ